MTDDLSLRRCTVLVMAKEPRPGRVKTRLCPPCTPDEAARIAAAALADTLRSATAVGAGRVVLALEGDADSWVPDGIEVISQHGNGLAERLANAWDDVGGPTIQIGMDTPQLTPQLLTGALASLHRPGVGAVLGPADDGGWWLIGLHRPDRRVFVGIPMSEPGTGARQLDRLRQLELEPVLLSTLRDIDTFADAIAVAADMPGSATATAAAAVSARLEGTGRATTEGHVDL